MSLTWGTSQKNSDNSLAQQFPNFRIDDATSGGNVNVSSKSPKGTVTQISVVESAGIYTANFTPTEVGYWAISVTYDGKHIRGSPFQVRVYDADSVRVYGLENGASGKKFKFTVDTTQGGDGVLEISVKRSGTKVPVRLERVNNDGKYNVEFEPNGAGLYLIDVTFSGMVVRGSPFKVDILDAKSVVASGNGLSLVEVNQRAQFTINTGDQARSNDDLRVSVTSPKGRPLPIDLYNLSSGQFRVEYPVPTSGDYRVDVLYHGNPIKNSPFTVHGFDTNSIKIRNIPNQGIIGKAVEFDIDTANAGYGDIEISINEYTVPCTVSKTPPTYHAKFMPQNAGKHTVDIRFNGRPIQQSPFTINISNNIGNVTVAGAGLKTVPIHQQASFEVHTGNKQNRDEVIATIKDPSGRSIPTHIINYNNGNYLVEYTPVEIGAHKIEVFYAGHRISGSPFICKVYDAAGISVSDIMPTGVGQIVKFKVDTRRAGEGDLSVMINEGRTRNKVETVQKGIYIFTYIPENTQPHSIQIRFNEEMLSNFPITVPVIDTNRVTVQGDGLHQAAVNKDSMFKVKTGTAGNADLAVRVTGPQMIEVPVKIDHPDDDDDDVFTVHYTATSVGDYRIDISYISIALSGSPFIAKAFDISQIVVEPVHNAVIGRQSSFCIITNKAGEGKLSVKIEACQRNISNSLRALTSQRYQVTFEPDELVDHFVYVYFNGLEVRGSPFCVKVADASLIRLLTENMGPVTCNRPARFTIHAPGVNHNEFLIKCTAPNRELVPSRIVLQPDKNYTVEYSSKYTGRHMVETLYANQPVMGSPFFVEIYDPNKIRIEGGTTGTVGMPVDFEVISIDAGKAELGVSVTSPSGHSLTYDLQPTPRGDRVRYTPNEQGAHQIFVTYGGLNVPGCPISQEIGIDSSVRTVFGEGAQSGTLNQPTSFFVDTQGRNGDLFIHIQGPTQTMRYTVKQEANGRYCVSYTPTETGQYRIELKFNGHTVNGTPLHPIISERGNVSALGLFDRMVNGKFNLTMNQMNTFEFDTSRSGEGVLRCEVRGPNGSVPVNVQGSAGRYVVSYMPTLEGDYQMSVYWNGQLMPEFPVTGSTQSYLSNGMQSSVQTNTMHQTTNYSNGGAPSYSDKVIMTGMGLNTANAQQMAEFVIDGSQAGQGIPIVKMNGQSDVAVDIVPLTNNRYKCSYTAMEPGFYMLSINWSERQVTGSPFKVNVVASTQPQNVQCRGDALSRAIALKQSEATIDVREAGPGMISAQCMGPTKVALCQIKLVDLGIYKLTMTPQENGRHILQIKYGKEHVPGSPFELKVSRPADASKVRVSGPGVENGILATYRSHFLCEMQGAGTGQLVVRVRGPSGAFNVDIQKGSDRTIMCRYDPTDVGRYRISVLWSDVEVPGSPFTVQIFDTKSQLDASAAKARYKRPPSTGPSVAFGGGGGGGMNRNALAAGVNGITLNEEY